MQPETRVQIRRHFYAEHWKIGTIAQALDVQPNTVWRAIEVERFQHAEPLRPSILDPYLPFVREVLEQHPRLRATRLHQMIRGRGYAGSVEQLRRVVARLRPQPREAFLRLQEIGTAILSSCPSKPAQLDDCRWVGRYRAKPLGFTSVASPRVNKATVCREQCTFAILSLPRPAPKTFSLPPSSY